MLADYLNQSVTWKRKTGTDPYAGDTYSSSTIKVRWEFDRRMVRNSEGQEVVSEGMVFASPTDAIGSDDLLVDDLGREWPVITVARIPGLDGGVHHLEVRL